jgi:hypothetical protein
MTDLLALAERLKGAAALIHAIGCIEAGASFPIEEDDDDRVNACIEAAAALREAHIKQEQMQKLLDDAEALIMRQRDTKGRLRALLRRIEACRSGNYWVADLDDAIRAELKP